MPLPEFFHRKKDPQGQIQRELERAQKSHDEFKESDLQLYKEMTAFIKQRYGEIELVLSRYSAGESDWRLALTHKSTIYELKKLLERAKLFRKEDRQSSISELSSISRKIGYLELPSVSNHDSDLGMMGNFGMREPIGYQAPQTEPSEYQRKKLDAIQLLQELEKEMSHVLDLIKERTE